MEIGDIVCMIDNTLFTNGLRMGIVYGYTKIHISGCKNLFNAIYIKNVKDPVLASCVIKISNEENVKWQDVTV